MSSNSLRLRTRLVVAGLAAVCILFGGLVYFKSVLLTRKQGDLGCFVRAGWAVRQGGAPLYQVMCDSQWHYNYPPLFAILMTPLADPPQRDLSQTAAFILGLNATPGGSGPLLAVSAAAASPQPLYPSGPYYVPFPVSVVVFYVISLLLLTLAVHLLANLLESYKPLPDNPEAAWLRYWRWRLGSVLVCSAPILLTLMRGQVQTLLLLLLVGVAVGLLRGKRLMAGMCIGGAVCLKLFPAFLVVLPLWRRDLRCLIGVVVAVVLGMGVIPGVVLGPRTTIQVYREFAEVLILPGLGLGGSHSRSVELTDVAATKSQAFQVVLVKTIHLGGKLPAQPAVWMKLVHWSLGAAMTLATLAFLCRPRNDGLALTAGVGMLALVMVILSPVCHLHYFTVGLPIVMALMACFEDRSLAMKVALGVLFAAIMAAWTVPMITGYGVLRDVGVPLAGALALWLTGLCTRWPDRAHEAAGAADVSRLAA